MKFLLISCLFAVSLVTARGSFTKDKQFFLGSVRDSGGRFHLCNGNFITTWTLLTTATCVIAPPGNRQLSVILVKDKLQNPKTPSIPVKHVLKHEDPDMNAALIYLDRTISNVVIFQIPSSYVDLSGSTAMQYYWLPIPTFQLSQNAVLVANEVTILSDSLCSVNHGAFVSNYHICVEGENITLTYKDVGGPLVVVDQGYGLLVGIYERVTFIKGGISAVYKSIFPFLKWVNEHKLDYNPTNTTARTEYTKKPFKSGDWEDDDY